MGLVQPCSSQSLLFPTVPSLGVPSLESPIPRPCLQRHPHHAGTMWSWTWLELAPLVPQRCLLGALLRLALEDTFPGQIAWDTTTPQHTWARTRYSLGKGLEGRADFISSHISKLGPQPLLMYPQILHCAGIATLSIHSARGM